MINVRIKIISILLIILVISIGLLSAYLFYLNNILDINRMKIDSLYSRINEQILQNKRIDIVLQGVLANIASVKYKLIIIIKLLKGIGILLSISVFFYKNLSIYLKFGIFISAVLFFLFFRIGSVI